MLAGLNTVSIPVNNNIRYLKVVILSYCGVVNNNNRYLKVVILSDCGVVK